MGNLQSTPSSSTTTTVQKKYDIFLNFRGEDTRNCFTCHLYEALHQKIETFIDNGLEKGDGIWPTLKGAIEQSKISVVIFSKDYASSKWYLRELVEIMDRKNTNKQIVIPVFYRVDPSDVRKQTGSFKDSFDKHGKESEEEVQNWREALTEASNLSGWDSSETRPDTTLVDQIVKDILKKLMGECTSHDYGALIGHKRIEEVLSLLCLHVPNVQIIGIWGMGGIGKTTIADAIFNKKSNQFDGFCFIQNVRERLQNSGGLVSLQKEIISKVLKDDDVKLDGPTIPSIIKERLNRKMVLIVLDDVDDYLPLEDLAGGVDRLGLGSRIIITSRDKQVLRLCGVNDQNIYEVEGFNYRDALQLFCNYAFHKNYPPEDRTVLSNQLVNYSKGNPLALKVLGSSLYQASKQEWESVVNTLRTKNLNRSIFNVLKISYDGLENGEKNTFLDIVCFFKGEERDYVEKIIGDCSMELGALIKKSLITISSYGCIQMHDLLEEMGREIVYEESPNKPGKRSRLWREEDVQNTLKYDEGTSAVQGIVLHLSKDMLLSSQAFKKMSNLRFLKFHVPYFDWPYYSKVHIPNGLSDLPGKLRSLIWFGFPLTALPSNFSPENLVELDLNDSNLEKLWEDTMHAPNLKQLILCGCKRLTNIPDLSNSPLLEKIDLEDCQSLLDFPSLAQHLKYLHWLNLGTCKSLRRFPYFPCSLTFLFLSNCNLKVIPEDVCHLSLLETLNLSGNDFESLPKSMKQLSILKNFLCSLRQLYLSYCNLKVIPEDVCHLSLLETLDLSGNDFESLPKSMKKLSILRDLNVDNCKMLQSLTELPSSIEILSASDCKQLRTILLDASVIVKAELVFTNCPNLEETAVGNILATVEGYEGELERFSFCCPGSEVPEWFSHKSNESSIIFQMPRQDCLNGLPLGFIVCAVIEFEEYCLNGLPLRSYNGEGLYVYCRGAFSEGDESDLSADEFSDGDERDLFKELSRMLVADYETLIDSDHVALWYCKDFDPPVFKSEFTNCFFEFWLSDLESTKCRVKSCGVLPRTKIPNEDDKVKYAEPIKIFGVTIEDIGETSRKRSRTSNDHQKEELELHFERLNLDLGETSRRRSHTSNDHQEEEGEPHSNCRVKSCGVQPITNGPNEDDKVEYTEPIKIFGFTIEDIGETSGKRSRTSNDHQEEEVEPHSKRLTLDLFH